MENLRIYAAEMVASFILTLSVILSVTASGPESFSTPIVAGLVVALFVYTIGSVSGAHINPAVTVGLYSIKKINITEGIIYIISQCLGGALAMFIADTIKDQPTGLNVATNFAVGFAEFLGAALLVFGVCSVVYKRVSDAAAGLVIGGSLLLGIIIASFMSNGILNPIIAIGLGSASFFYLVAPLIGGVAGAWLAKYLYNK